MAPFREVRLHTWTEAGCEYGRRCVPEEVPVALRLNCRDYAVMLASPADLEDFVYGFLLTERQIERAEDIAELSFDERAEGIVARVTLRGSAADRQRPDGGQRLPGATGCGLCGVQSLRDAVRPVPRVAPAPRIAPEAVCRAVAALRDWQPLNASAGALHAAAFADIAGNIVTAREDVGRHNALDKLIGALLRDGRTSHGGLVVMSSRCSYELVQKAAAFGVSLLCTVSAPTALAIRLAEEAGMTLISLVHADSFAVLTGADCLDWHKDG
ncbi:hypothetical protein BW247_08350 [Acidihalobacter ferrooxydans]|uniref:Sulfur carrier protein FdhD n=1 Tax=Acidihalobacter ferrooxydans TaxID=1765967 RepID=A0A1P8ULD6_9GAMM|nr:hypothetical protein BW247_08350 [Acidihalobacter ferrooxydans]